MEKFRGGLKHARLTLLPHNLIGLPAKHHSFHEVSTKGLFADMPVHCSASSAKNGTSPISEHCRWRICRDHKL